MHNIHLDFMRRARFCDPTGGFATMGVIMAVGAVAGGVSAYGQHSQGQSKGKMYNDQAMNNALQASMLRQNAEENVKLTEQARDENIGAIQTDASQASQDIMEAGSKLLGTQKVVGAAQGHGGGSVSDFDVQNDAAMANKKDQIALQYNADAKSVQITNEAADRIYNLRNDAGNAAWALGRQADQYNKAASNERMAGTISAAGTVLSTAASVANMGMMYGSSWRSPTKTKTDIFAKDTSTPTRKW